MLLPVNSEIIVLQSLDYLRNGKRKKRIKGSEKNLGGTMRLGLYDAVLKNNSLISKIYSEKKIKERHRHRYEVNIEYKEDFEKKVLFFLLYLQMVCFPK